MPTPVEIAYTLTDEAPALATRSWLPIVRAFLADCGVTVRGDDISLCGRILAKFPEYLPEEKRIEDALEKLGRLAKTPHANIIKLPNISASVPQLTAAIKELRSQGLMVPEYPADPKSDDEKIVREKYNKVLGSAVNPVLREGNSDRRVAKPVKQYAKANPHSMGTWSPLSKSRVAHMSEGDFYGSEKSVVIQSPGTLQIQHVDAAGKMTVLRDGVKVTAHEIFDGAVMSKNKLRGFIASAIDAAKAEGLLFSVHLKATMMKVSDPIIFGHVLGVFYQTVFDRYGDVLAGLGVDPNQGLGAMLAKIDSLPDDQKQSVRKTIADVNEQRPPLAMVDSNKGITNLHVPSDVIIDASMPAAIRSAGQMWGADGKPYDMLALIPDRCYAGVYQATIDDCKAHGTYEVSTLGSVANVGLMAQKAEEYGSHDKTFEVPSDGFIRVVDASGTVVMEHAVQAGDIWRACQTKDVAIVDWVKLAVVRARATTTPAVFWLDEQRAHDRNLIHRVQQCLSGHDCDGLDIQILSPIDATKHACQRMRAGLDTISVTGNVLRDYLTDLFPIIELGTSAKMLSIVPLLEGGGLFETGAGGSAPKHVQQFVAENHLRWDSLGEFLALGVSLEDLAMKTARQDIAVMAKTLDDATTIFLKEDKSPGRDAGELDNRGSHFYLALYWAEALASQTLDGNLRSRFEPVAKALREQESKIIHELAVVQGSPVDIGGYYYPDPTKMESAMRPSATFNAALELI